MTYKRILQVPPPISLEKSVEFEQNDLKTPEDKTPPECSLDYFNYMAESYVNLLKKGGLVEKATYHYYLSYKELQNQYTEWMKILDFFLVKIKTLSANEIITVSDIKQTQKNIITARKKINTQYQLVDENIDTLNLMRPVISHCKSLLDEKRNLSLFSTRLPAYIQQISEVIPSSDSKEMLQCIQTLQQKINEQRQVTVTSTHVSSETSNLKQKKI